jgi:hypothetical protein
LNLKEMKIGEGRLGGTDVHFITADKVLHLRIFSKKRIKKNSKKGCQLEKFKEMGASRPLNGLKKISRDLFANKKTFFIREEVPEADLPPGHRAGCSWSIFVIFFLRFFVSETI